MEIMTLDSFLNGKICPYLKERCIKHKCFAFEHRQEISYNGHVLANRYSCSLLKWVVQEENKEEVEKFNKELQKQRNSKDFFSSGMIPISMVWDSMYSADIGD